MPVNEGQPGARAATLDPRAYEALFEHSLDPTLFVRGDGTVIRANAAAAVALGRTLPELVGRHRADLFVEDEALRALVAARARTGFVRSELTLRRADGTTFPADVVSGRLELEQEPIAYVVFRDLTSAREAARVLLETEQRFAAVFDHSPVGMALSSLPDTRYVAANDAWRALFEVGDVDVAGKTGVDLGIATREDWERTAEALRREGSLRGREVTRFTRAGEERVLLLSMEPLTIGGRPHVLSMALDVTELPRHRTR